MKREVLQALALVGLVTGAAMSLAPAPTAAQRSGPLDRAVLLQHAEARETDAIAAYGPDVMPVLIDLYREGDTERRTRLASVFYALGWRSEEAKELLMRDARSLDEDLRINAQYALGRVSDDPAVVDILIENLQTGFNPLVRDKAACGLAYDQVHLGDRQKARMFRKLIELLESPNPETRSLAIRVLHVHTGQLKGFFAAWPEEGRATSVARWRQWIEEYEANL